MITLDDRTVVSLLFNEQADSLAPSDGTGNFGDLADDATTSMPTVVAGTLTGFGRDFVAGAATAIKAADSGDAAQLTREVTIAGLIAWDIAAQDSYGSDGTLIQRGEGPVGDALSWALKFSVKNVAARSVRVYLEWQTAAGSLVTDTGAEFTYPDDGEDIFIAAVREIVGGLLVCRYHVNGSSLEAGSYPLDVGSTSGADLWVGGRYNGATYGGYLDAVVDSIEVYSEAVSAEELLWTWQRMANDMPDGISAIKALIPPGPYSTDPDSSVQREFSLQGAALGIVRSNHRRMRDYFWPDVAWGTVLERWETVTGHTPKPGDSLATRRERIVSFIGTIRGPSVPDVKAVLEETLDLDSADIAILEYDNDYAQDFATDPGDYIRDQGTASLAVSVGSVLGTATADDIRFHGITAAKAPWMLWTVASELDAWVSASVYVDAASDAEMAPGLIVGSKSKDEWLLFVLDNSGAGSGNLIRYAVFAKGALGAWTTVGWANDDVFFRIRCNGGGAFELRYGETAALADAANPAVVAGGPESVEWAGFVVTSAPNATPITGDCEHSDLLIHAPNGGQRFNWYAYRDLALAGNPDIDGANLVVQRVRQSHRKAAAITQQSVLCDDTASGCDREPIGL